MKHETTLCDGAEARISNKTDRPTVSISIAFFVLHDVNIENLDIFFWLLFVGSGVFDFLDYIESLCRATKYSMLAVKPRLQHKFG